MAEMFQDTYFHRMSIRMLFFLHICRMYACVGAIYPFEYVQEQNHTNGLMKK